MNRTRQDGPDGRPGLWPGPWPEGWDRDDHAAAWAAFCTSAAAAGPPWAALAEEEGDARATFGRLFAPAPPVEGLLTGYWEPEIAAALAPSPGFAAPLLGLPPGPGPFPDRAGVMAGALSAHALAWAADPLDAFLLEVQGSGRLRLPDGSVRRIGYAGRNGHPYRSIGQALVARGAVAPEAVSAQAIRAWARAHPGDLPALLALNPSVVFFRWLDLPPDLGPLGTLGVPLLPGRSLAVDPAHVPLGAPVWVEAEDEPGFPRLMVAQDTGGAIKGAGRADAFLGWGAAAGERAGRLRARARLTVLRPVPDRGGAP
jgi:membrane-bound lytic murein transglycosylase A